MDPILVTAKEAALWTGRPVGTIWRWANEHRIKSYPGRIKKDTRYDLRELPPAKDGKPAEPPRLPESVAA